jgi:hypothetical protein
VVHQALAVRRVSVEQQEQRAIQLLAARLALLAAAMAAA